MASGYTFLGKGLPAHSRRIHGVGFAIRTKQLQTLPESPLAISERLVTPRIPLAKHRYATFISTYAPTLLSNDETKDHCHAMLRSTLMQVPRRDKLIVFGDFNARIGSDSKIWVNVMGKHGVGNINSNGHRLFSLCSEFGLFVTNTLFQLKHNHKTTWMHPLSKHWHLLDYVLVKAVDLQDIQITRVMRGAECWTDHRLVRSSLRIRIRLPTRKQKPQRRLNVNGLGRRAGLSSLRAAISSNLAQVSDCLPLPFQSSSDATKQWDTLSKAVMDAAVDTLGYSTRKHQDCLTVMMLKYKRCLTSGPQHLALNSETPTQLNSSTDGSCSVHNCKNDSVKWRTHGGSPRLLKYKTMRMQMWRISFIRQ